jgi:hypothetical protein
MNYSVLRHSIAGSGLLLTSYVLLVLVGRIGMSADEPAVPKLPPLVIDRGAPLLLDEAPAKARQDLRFLTINRACYVCHENYRDEGLAMVHAKESVSCMDCHGPSLKHRDDEDHLTPPDIMFPAAKIDDACAECHDTHDAPAREVLARWKERCPEKTDFATVVCTDCHGEHRLDRRTIRWDKQTGKLLTDTSPDKSTATQPAAPPSGD